MNDVKINVANREYEEFQLSLIPDGFLKDYTDFAAPYSEAPAQFHFGVALSCLAAVLGRNIYLPFGYFNVYPNLYLLILGESGLPRKSTALNLGSMMLNRINPNYLIGPISSLEGFIDAFVEHNNRILIAPEIRLLLLNDSKKYGSGLITLLTDLYDCKDILKLNFKSLPENKRIIEYPTLNILSASTIEWLKPTVREEALCGGFWGRFLFIYGKSDKVIPIPPIMDKDVYNSLIKRLEAFTELKGVFSLDNKAEELYRALYEQDRKAYLKDPDKEVTTSFYSRFSIHLLKIAMLFRVSKENNDFTITKHDISRSYCFMKTAESYFRFLVEDVSKTYQMKLEEKFINLLDPIEWKAHSEIMNRLHIDKRQMAMMVDTLVEKELIEAKEEMVGKSKKKLYSLKIND